MRTKLRILLSALALTWSMGSATGEPSPAPPVTMNLTQAGDAPPAAQLPAPGELTTNGVRFWPDLDSPALTWFAVIVILLLTLQSSPVVSLRNLDGLVLAAACLLLMLRFDTGSLPRGVTGKSVQWWTYLLLSVIAGYWLVRGAQVAFARVVPAGHCNVSKSAMCVLVAAALAVAANRVVTAPISPGSRDALIGGLYVANFGKLPYGQTGGHDAGSPLLYLLHAGAVRVLPPTLEQDHVAVPLRWSSHTSWMTGSWWEEADLSAVRLANGFLVAAVLGGLLWIGCRLHSLPLGLTLLTIFCVFPGTVECFNRPEIMLPATLLTWTLAFALQPGVGGFLSLLFLVLTGLAWPWAWLALPVPLFYFLRQGWQGPAAVLGLVGGAALCVVGLTWLVAPSIPRVNGALAAAGLQATYTAETTDAGGVKIVTREPDKLVREDFKASFWKFLVERESADLSDAAAALDNRITPPAGVEASKVQYRAIQASDLALTPLQQAYQKEIAGMPPVNRMWVALRTALEATWLPATEPAPPLAGAWTLWAGQQSEHAERWTLVRRGAKVAVGLFSLVLAVFLFTGRRTDAHHLVGALLAVGSAILLVSETGAVANLAWLAPLALALLAAHGGQPAATSGAASGSELEALPKPPGLRREPAPRISIEH